MPCFVLVSFFLNDFLTKYKSFQTVCMFLGEFLCLIAFQFVKLGNFVGSKISKPKHEDIDGSVNSESESTVEKPAQKQESLNPLVFAIPAFCDLFGSTLLNFGLIFTYASVYQMLRSSLVIFTGVLSVIFLKRRLYPHHWGGIALIFIGTALVGLSSVLFSNTTAQSAQNPFLGNILVVVAQVIASVQMVVEEKLVQGADAAPLQVVGYEGYWGLSMTTLCLFVLYWIPGSDYGSAENTAFAFAQMFRDYKLALAIVGSVCSIAFFNFFGITIAKRMSSTARSTIDSLRTFIIWIISLLIGWESFQWLQLVGFIILVSGSFLYNEVIRVPFYHAWYKKHYADHLKYIAEKKKNKAMKQQSTTTPAQDDSETSRLIQ